MADTKETPKPFFTTEKVTLYAPKGAKFHTHQQEVSVQARQKDKFLKLGYTESKDAALEAEAHPAIAIPQPKVKASKVKNEPDLNKDPE
jgi:hypothetical protein